MRLNAEKLKAFKAFAMLMVLVRRLTSDWHNPPKCDFIHRSALPAIEREWDEKLSELDARDRLADKVPWEVFAELNPAIVYPGEYRLGDLLEDVQGARMEDDATRIGFTRWGELRGFSECIGGGHGLECPFLRPGRFAFEILLSFFCEDMDHDVECEDVTCECTAHTHFRNLNTAEPLTHDQASQNDLLLTKHEQFCDDDVWVRAAEKIACFTDKGEPLMFPALLARRIATRETVKERYGMLCRWVRYAPINEVRANQRMPRRLWGMGIGVCCSKGQSATRKVGKLKDQNGPWVKDNIPVWDYIYLKKAMVITLESLIKRRLGGDMYEKPRPAVVAPIRYKRIDRVAAARSSRIYIDGVTDPSTFV